MRYSKQYMKTAVFIHELEQLSMLDALLRDWADVGEGPLLVSLDASVDYELKRKGISFLSAGAYQNSHAPSSYLRADELSRALCSSEKIASMQYHGISIMAPLQFTLHLYFIDLLYYVELIARIIDERVDITRLVALSPTVVVSSTSAPLAEHESFIVMEAARLVARSRKLAFGAGQGSLTLRFQGKLHLLVFACKRALFGVALSVLNACMSLRHQRTMRIIVSDYWRNIAPVLRELPEAETILLDRGEAVQAGWKNIWRHQMRFLHIDGFASRQARREALRQARLIRDTWHAIRGTAWQSVDFMFCGVSLAPISEMIMSRLLDQAVPRVTRMITGIEAMFKELDPDAVLLRASVSRQIHFILLPLVANKKGIPAFEIQHGGEYLGPGSATISHAARYIATYGPLVSKEYEAAGYAPDRLIAAGSPRFDSYIHAIPEKKPDHYAGPLTILSNTPNPNVGERHGTYSLETYFKALGDAVRSLSGVHLEIASRSRSQDQFLSEVRQRGLGSVPYETVGTTPLPKLFARADIFVCSHSTVVYEALLYRLPVVIASFAPVEKMMTDFHFGPFERAGAIRIAHTPEELREILTRLATDPEARARMSAAGEAFMREQFSFDGHAAERIAQQVRTWAR